MKCIINDCQDECRGKHGLCNKHRIRMQRHGDVNYYGHIANSGSFTKGTVPWNTGTKGIMKPNSGTFTREKLLGDKHWNWQGGITPEHAKIRNSIEYTEWRKAVFERDNYTCRCCGARSGNGMAVVLHADHIKPFAYNPKLRLDINNGKTLCVDCHRATPTFAGRSRKYATS